MSELVVAVVLALAALLAIEILFRVALAIRGTDFRPPRRVRDLYVDPHPYLPYVFRAGARVKNDGPAPYPLHRGRFEFRAIRTNSLGLLGDEVALPKPQGTYRVLCLGASVTENSIWEVGGPTEHTFPIHLQRELDERGDRRFEVLNCGVGGWTTAEILVNFALRLADLGADAAILYHGVGDLGPSLTAPFKSDYSHSRRNFGETYERIRLASRLPSLPWWKSYSYLTAKFIGHGNVRHDLASAIRVRRPDITQPFMGLATERRNVESLIQLCRSREVVPILATFAYHVYEDVKDDATTLRYREGVVEENAMLREVAAEHGLALVDIATEIPDEDAYFLDTVHLTPDGMRFVARRFADAVLKVARTRPGSLSPARS